MDGRIARLQGVAKGSESWVGLGCLVIGWCICVRPAGWLFLGACVDVSGIGEAGVFCRLNKSRADDVEECHLAICRLFFARRLISSADSDFDKQNSIPATVPTMVREVNTRPEIRETEARRREVAEVALAAKPEVYGSGVDAMLDRQLQELVDNRKASGSGEISKEVLMDPKPREAIDQGWVDVGDVTSEAPLDTQGSEPKHVIRPRNPSPLRTRPARKHGHSQVTPRPRSRRQPIRREWSNGDLVRRGNDGPGDGSLIDGGLGHRREPQRRGS
ncbi:hypothetical protein BDP67DRAFT_607443 [Colletotrichum lupini]|nr:hypothetical protein BDP67DRAFT_607443 [Colletotrichum lupini]